METTSTTSTKWRDDEKNLYFVRKVNEAYERLPFSREYEGVLDQPPVKIEWEIGPNLPVAWKGGVAGLFGDEMAMVGGLWMPGRDNLAYAYHTKDRTYSEIPPPPYATEYTQGAYDGQALYVIGGRAAGGKVSQLTRTGEGRWRWRALPPLPESTKGRWLAATGVVPGKWLFLVAGHPTGTPSEVRSRPALPDWRLRLDRAGATWEPMAPYPGGTRSLLSCAVVRKKLYVFGGSLADPVMRSIQQELAQEYALPFPYGGVPNYRDAYCYDPETDRWLSLRNLPFPMGGGPMIALGDRYVLLMGSADVRTYRVGKSKNRADPFWGGYGDMILCYDVELDNYSRVGVMPYGIATCHWVCDGERVYGFGGEPAHGYNLNTENVAQIGTIQEIG